MVTFRTREANVSAELHFKQGWTGKQYINKSEMKASKNTILYYNTMVEKEGKKTMLHDSLCLIFWTMLGTGAMKDCTKQVATIQLAILIVEH